MIKSISSVEIRGHVSKTIITIFLSIAGSLGGLLINRIADGYTVYQMGASRIQIIYTISAEGMEEAGRDSSIITDRNVVRLLHL